MPMPHTAAMRLATIVFLTACTLVSACGGGGSSGGSGGGTSSSTSSSDSLSSSRTALDSYALTGQTNLVHDPAIIRQGTTYYVFTTDHSATAGGFIGIRCTADKIAYSGCGFVFPTLPVWINTAVPAVTTIWAPDISYFGGQYHLYYAVSSFGSNISAIGHATSPTLDQRDPAYHWTDHGPVLQSSNTSTFNAIDPNILADSDGRVWLSYGSFWDGIFQQEIDPATGQVKAGVSVYHLARRATTVQYDPVEGASLVHKGGYYYLFVSWDFCCETNPRNSNYKIVVGRGTSPNGPFLDKAGFDLLTGGGTVLLEGNSQWSGPGGQTAYIDPVGGDLITFHALKLAENGMDYVFVKSLDFASGWPVIQP